MKQSIMLMLCLFSLASVYTQNRDSLPPLNDGMIYKIVETMPEYPGGDEALQDYLRSFKVPADDALLKQGSAKVYVEFIVEKTGAVGRVKVAKTSGFATLDAATVQHVQAMPRWTPGYQRGKPVAVQYVVPFVVEF